jgi:aspartate carbamoyltransferase catalytic subunit
MIESPTPSLAPLQGQPREAPAPQGTPSPVGLRGRHLLGIEELSAEEIVLILDTAEAMKEVGSRTVKKVPALRGRTVVNLFFEPSTRTRTSFEVAGKRLSADVVNISVSGSSISKGETLVDTAQTLDAMSPDCIVVRHGTAGVPHQISRHSRASIVNAGDGSHEHPTQALLDAFTIRRRKQRFDGLKVAIVGDILHSRVARSNLHALTTLGSEVWLAGPPTLIPPDIEKIGCRPIPGLHVTLDMNEAITDADVIMMLRVQFERMNESFFPSAREYCRHYGLSTQRLELARSDVVVMHPGPINRGIEIAADVADGPHSVILDQVSAGIAVRMAVLYHLLGGA